MYRLFVFALLAAAAAEDHKDVCPELKPLENFNVTAYQGVWYEISKLPSVSEPAGGQCSSAEYKVDGDVVKVKNTNVLNGVQTFIEGTAKFAADANNAAKLEVTFKFGDVTSMSPLMVLATDYNNYAIAYNCKYDEKTKTHKDHAWILSRKMTLEGDAKTAVDNFLKSHAKELDATKLIPTDFSEAACKFTSTSAITEKPIKA